MSCKRWVKVLRFFALERLLNVTRNVYSAQCVEKNTKLLNLGMNRENFNKYRGMVFVYFLQVCLRSPTWRLTRYLSYVVWVYTKHVYMCFVISPTNHLFRPEFQAFSPLGTLLNFTHIVSPIFASLLTNICCPLYLVTSWKWNKKNPQLHGDFQPNFFAHVSSL